MATAGAPNGGDWSLRANLELCGSALPPAYAGLSTDAHLSTFDVSESGGAALLGADGRLYLANLFHQPASANKSAEKSSNVQLLAHVALDPPLQKQEVATVELVQLNAGGSHVLLVAKTWIKAVKLPSDARAVLSPALAARSTASSSGRRRAVRRDAGVARYRVRLADGSEQEVILPTKNADNELERVQKEVMGHRRVASVSKELGVASMRQVGYFPGVRQVAWHPLSDTHVVVLSDAEEIALFNLRLDVSKPEQRHFLEFPPTSSSANSSGTGVAAVSTAFSFGAPSPLRHHEHLQAPMGRWDPFTCYVLRSDGAIYALCPLVPYDCRVSRTLLQSLRTEVDAQIVRCKKQLGASDQRHVSSSLQARIAELKSHKYWLQEAWAPVTTHRKISAPNTSAGHDDSDDAADDDAEASLDLFRFLTPHASGISPETWPLAVQGPVDVTPKSVVAGKNHVAGGSSATSLLAVPHPPRGNSSSASGSPMSTAAPFLIRSYTSGHVELVLLDAPIRPRWKSELRAKGEDTLPALLLECLNLGIDDSGGKAVLAGDPTDPRLVYCLHSTGVHVMNVSWVLALAAGKQFTSLPKSSVRHIFSVSPTKSAASTASTAAVSNVIGTRVAKNVDFGHLLLLRLASGNFEVVNVSAASTELLKGGLLDGESADERGGAHAPATNPLASSSKTRTAGASSSGAAAAAAASGLRPFADIVEEKLDVLNPRGTRVTGKTQLHEVDAAVLAFVVERVKILYEDVEYVDAIDQLLRDRLLVHRDMLTAQNDKAAAVRSTVDAAKQSLKGLQEKMEKALAVQQNLSKRAAAVLQAVKENQPNLSRAEREYKSELERLSIDVRRMQPHVTQLTVSGQRLVRSLEAAGHRRTFSMDSSMSSAGGVGAVLTDDKKRMCYDVLRAETQLIDDTKSLLEELSAGLQQLHT